MGLHLSPVSPGTLLAQVDALTGTTGGTDDGDLATVPVPSSLVDSVGGSVGENCPANLLGSGPLNDTLSTLIAENNTTRSAIMALRDDVEDLKERLNALLLALKG